MFVGHFLHQFYSQSQTLTENANTHKIVIMINGWEVLFLSRCCCRCHCCCWNFHFHCVFSLLSLSFLQRPLLINYNAGILMTNGMLWNIHKIARYGDTYMILDRHKLKFSGNLLIEKVNVSVPFISIRFFVLILHLLPIGLCDDQKNVQNFDMELRAIAQWIKKCQIFGISCRSLQHTLIFIDYTNDVNNNISHALISQNFGLQRLPDSIYCMNAKTERRRKRFLIHCALYNVQMESIRNQFESIEVIGVGVSRTSQITFDS